MSPQIFLRFSNAPSSCHAQVRDGYGLFELDQNIFCAPLDSEYALPDDFTFQTQRQWRPQILAAKLHVTNRDVRGENFF